MNNTIERYPILLQYLRRKIVNAFHGSHYTHMRPLRIITDNDVVITGTF